MSDSTIIHSTFTIERRYAAPPARVFAAFADKAIKTRWYADGKDLAVEQFDMDFRIGGRDVARFRFGDKSPFPGVPLAYHITYQDIVPDKCIVYAYTLTFGDNIVSASLVTFELLPVDGGTELLFTEQGAYWEGADGPQMREHGWRVLLEKLTTAFGK